MLEDILNTNQRPKFQDFEKYIYIVFRMLIYDNEKQTIESEQVSLVFGSNFVISFQETIGDIFDQIRDSIRTSKGRHRKMGSDYLAYSLIDAIVDNYFLILEKLGDKIGLVEEKVVVDPTAETLHQIQLLKRELVSLRGSVWPLRELINGFQRSESPLIHKSTGVYLRDVYDHTVQIIDATENFRDMCAAMLEVYVSSVSNKLNSIMKVLTVIATIFMPLSFIASLYGMNFDYMPETHRVWGYPAVLIVMFVATAGMLL